MNLKQPIFFSYFSILFFFLSATIQSQNQKVYNWFDAVTGDENPELYNGVLYVEEFKVINDKHRFFKTDKFLQGNVSFNGNTYYDQDLKYDLFYDELLVKPKTASDVLLLQMVKSKIDSFTVKEHKFIKINNKENIRSNSEFYEKLSENKKINLLKKHSVARLGKTDKQLYYEFRPKTKLFIFYNGIVYPANKKSDLISIFPEQKKLIRKIYSKNVFLKKSNPDYFISYLINEIQPFYTN